MGRSGTITREADGRESGRLVGQLLARLNDPINEVPSRVTRTRATLIRGPRAMLLHIPSSSPFPLSPFLLLSSAASRWLVYVMVGSVDVDNKRPSAIVRLALPCRAMYIIRRRRDWMGHQSRALPLIFSFNKISLPTN